MSSAPRLSPPTDSRGYQPELQVTLDDLLRNTAKLRALDPVTTELVRLRGARRHNCRICQSMRTISALDAGASEEMYRQIDHYESSDLSERHKVALRLVDALVTQPGEIGPELAGQVRTFFTPAEVAEILADVMRNSMQKVAVTLAFDAANVTDGVEYYDVDSNGELVYPDKPAVTA